MLEVYGIDIKVCVPPRGVFVLPQTASDAP
jgi:hypothetical protein